MRRAALVTLGVGMVLLALSVILFVALGTVLVVCPNPGVCRQELQWPTLIPGVVTSSLGVLAIIAAWILNWSGPPRRSSS